MMNRRKALQLSVGMAAVLLLGGHTPYKQWVVYRKKHLLIGSHKEDMITYDLAKRVVGLLTEHLPTAKSRIVRAPDAGRLSSLLGTAQMEVAVLNTSDTINMMSGLGKFKSYGMVPLRVLIPITGRLLVAQANFPKQYAWLITRALVGTDLVRKPLRLSDMDSVPWHPGSLAFLQGLPEPN